VYGARARGTRYARQKNAKIRTNQQNENEQPKMLEVVWYVVVSQ
jgi:hypothetical protein